MSCKMKKPAGQKWLRWLHGIHCLPQARAATSSFSSYPRFCNVIVCVLERQKSGAGPRWALAQK